MDASSPQSDLSSPSQVRRLLADLDIVPNRVLGQSFLIDRNVLGILVRTLDPGPGSAVLEVGPGLGVVTEQLAGKCGHVLAVEKDRRLYEYLVRRLGGVNGLELICADMVEQDAARLMGRAWSARRRAAGQDRVVSNLPYSVGSRILVDLVRAPSPPSRIVVTVQEEVGRRLAAKPGSRHYGMLSVWIGVTYEVELVKLVSPNCFWPRPEVSSAIVRMDRRDTELLTTERREVLYRVTKAAFAQRRKQLGTTLDGAGDVTGLGPGEFRGLLMSLGIDAHARPEAVSVEQWCAIARLL